MTSTTQTKISSKLYREAAIDAQVNNITVDEQVALWARVGKAALDNPDLPAAAIKDILIAKKQVSEPFSLREIHT
ncbi:MAG: hypothetical protein ACI3WT_03610 [Phascolarctobacterium sp.]